MSTPTPIPAALALDGLPADARSAFSIAADNGFRGIAFATNHAQLNAAELGPSARRQIKSILAGKGLAIESLRAAVPRGGLTDSATIDRTLDSARKAMLLARELGVSTVAVHIGALAAAGLAGTGGIPESTLISAMRELSQHADASGLTLAFGAEDGGGADSGAAIGRILKQVDYDRARVNLDTARIIGIGEDPLKVAETLLAIGADSGGALGQVTAADAIRAGRSVRAALLGEGQLALPELLTLLREQGFTGPLVVDVRDLPDGIAGAQRAAEVIRHAYK